jgi:hypothetical protein
MQFKNKIINYFYIIIYIAMTSRRVGRPCAKTTKIKIKKQPKMVKIKIVKPKPKPKTVKIKIVKKRPPTLPPKPRKRTPPIRDSMAIVRLSNSNNRIEKDKIKRAKSAIAFKERARIISATNRQKVVKRRMEKEIEREIKTEEAKILADMRAQAKISMKFRKDMLTKFKGKSFADKARGL